jgi:transcriptional regulator with XRE-family HTH domain
MTAWTTFGQRLQELRGESGLSQTQLAEAANLPLATIRGYEQGRREPSWDVMFRLVKALGVSCERFADCARGNEGQEFFSWGGMTMQPTFIRIFDKAKDKEILININAISEIHVEYVVMGTGAQKKVGFSVGLGEARTNPDAIRIYHVMVGGTKHTLAANPGSPIMQILDEIYKNAIKNEN